jgi:hypothetical protein
VCGGITLFASSSRIESLASPEDRNTKAKPKKDTRPHRFSDVKRKDPKWTDEEDDLLESAVVNVCELYETKPFWARRSSMKDGQFIHIQDGFFWLRVSEQVPGKSSAECFLRYAGIQDSAVAKFTVRTSPRVLAEPAALSARR